MRERVVVGILCALGIAEIVGTRIEGRGAIGGDVVMALLFREAGHSLECRWAGMRGHSPGVNKMLFQAKFRQEAKPATHESRGVTWWEVPSIFG
jgi:hypothetical protein